MCRMERLSRKRGFAAGVGGMGSGIGRVSCNPGMHRHRLRKSRREDGFD
jgi:hypothetical protein